MILPNGIQLFTGSPIPGVTKIHIKANFDPQIQPFVHLVEHLILHETKVLKETRVNYGRITGRTCPGVCEFNLGVAGKNSNMIIDAFLFSFIYGFSDKNFNNEIATITIETGNSKHVCEYTKACEIFKTVFTASNLSIKILSNNFGDVISKLSKIRNTGSPMKFTETKIPGESNITKIFTREFQDSDEQYVQVAGHPSTKSILERFPSTQLIIRKVMNKLPNSSNLSNSSTITSMRDKSIITKLKSKIVDGCHILGDEKIIMINMNFANPQLMASHQKSIRAKFRLENLEHNLDKLSEVDIPLKTYLIISGYNIKTAEAVLKRLESVVRNLKNTTFYKKYTSDALCTKPSVFGIIKLTLKPHYIEYFSGMAYGVGIFQSMNELTFFVRANSKNINKIQIMHENFIKTFIPNFNESIDAISNVCTPEMLSETMNIITNIPSINEIINEYNKMFHAIK